MELLALCCSRLGLENRFQVINIQLESLRQWPSPLCSERELFGDTRKKIENSTNLSCANYVRKVRDVTNFCQGLHSAICYRLHSGMNGETSSGTQFPGQLAAPCHSGSKDNWSLSEKRRHKGGVRCPVEHPLRHEWNKGKEGMNGALSDLNQLSSGGHWNWVISGMRILVGLALSCCTRLGSSFNDGQSCALFPRCNLFAGDILCGNAVKILLFLWAPPDQSLCVFLNGKKPWWNRFHLPFDSRCQANTRTRRNTGNFQTTFLFVHKSQKTWEARSGAIPGTPICTSLQWKIFQKGSFSLEIDPFQQVHWVNDTLGTVRNTELHCEAAVKLISRRHIENLNLL